MKNGAIRGIIQFILALAVVIFLDKFYFMLLGKVNFKPTGSLYSVMYLIKFIIELIVVVIIYHEEIFAGKSRFNKSLLSSSIIALVTFIVMVVFTLILEKVLHNLGINATQDFVNYFAQTMTFDSALQMIITCFLKPCLYTSIFVLGISNIISKEYLGMLISGILYGVFILFMMNNLHINSFLHIIIPMVNIIALSYLYKSTGNIYTCFITFILYNLCGGLLLSYIF
jgi:membrane protease YdiL (CAAX protease family)